MEISQFDKWVKENFIKYIGTNHKPHSLKHANALKELLLFKGRIVQFFPNLQELQSFYEKICNGNSETRYSDGMQSAILKELERRDDEIKIPPPCSPRGDRNNGRNITYYRSHFVTR